MKRMILAALFLVAAGGGEAFAQYPEDALRFSTPGIGVGARAIGMGGAYTGVASDYSAIFWNPAGLAQAAHSEFSLGLSYLNNSNNSSFLDNQESYSVNSTALNTAGLVFPLPVRRGSAVIAFGFHRESSFADGVSYNGFNPTSSIIQWYAKDGSLYPSDLSSNVAYQLYLANLDTINGTWISPIKDRVTQIGKVVEEGGLNNWSLGGAFDVAKNVSLGVTVTYVAGSYRYDRHYEEKDSKGVYSTFPFDFSSVALDDYIEDDISGWNAKFGLMYRIPDHFRLGLTVKTPTWFYIHESFGTSGSSYFDDGSVLPVDGPFFTSAGNDYDVQSPWVFGAGSSLILGPLVVSADAEYTDWTELEFDHANPDIMQQNAEMKTLFRGAWNLRGGAEFEVPWIGLRLRAGYIYNQSPYKGDPTSFDQEVITGGLGIPLGEAVMADLAYAEGWRNTYIYNYQQYDPAIPPPRVDEKIISRTFMLTLTCRF